MSTTSSIQALLLEIKPIYDKIQQLLEQSEALQTVAQARDDYQACFAEQDKELKEFKECEQELDAEKRRLRWVPVTKPRRPSSWRRHSRRPSQPLRPVEPTPDRQPTDQSPTPEEIAEAKRQLTKLIGQYQFSLRLDSTLLGKVNYIAKDAEGSLGKALAMLPWRVFEHRKLTRKGEKHLARLITWKQVLRDYHRELKRVVSLEEMSTSRWEGIWKRWQARTTSEAGQQEWESFINETRQAKLKKIETLKQTIAQLEAEIAELAEQNAQQ